MDKCMKKGDRVYVSGEVKYGDAWLRAATEGVLENIGKIRSLVTLDRIDGDANACVFVKNKYIQNIDEEAAV